jgi:hypothetical protein
MSDDSVKRLTDLANRGGVSPTILLKSFYPTLDASNTESVIRFLMRQGYTERQIEDMVRARHAI